mgnify:CR=1 FL=1
MTVGRIMMPSSTDAARMDEPEMSAPNSAATVRMHGTMTTMPKKP